MESTEGWRVDHDSLGTGFVKEQYDPATGVTSTFRKKIKEDVLFGVNKTRTFRVDRRPKSLFKREISTETNEFKEGAKQRHPWIVDASSTFTVTEDEDDMKTAIRFLKFNRGSSQSSEIRLTLSPQHSQHDLISVSYYSDNGEIGSIGLTIYPPDSDKDLKRLKKMNLVEKLYELGIEMKSKDGKDENHELDEEDQIGEEPGELTSEIKDWAEKSLSGIITEYTKKAIDMKISKWSKQEQEDALLDTRKYIIEMIQRLPGDDFSNQDRASLFSSLFNDTLIKLPVDFNTMFDVEHTTALEKSFEKAIAQQLAIKYQSERDDAGSMEIKLSKDDEGYEYFVDYNENEEVRIERVTSELFSDEKELKKGKISYGGSLRIGGYVIKIEALPDGNERVNIFYGDEMLNRYVLPSKVDSPSIIEQLTTEASSGWEQPLQKYCIQQQGV